MANDRMVRILLAATTFLVAFATYWLTVAPTVSFWDCGEFIAAANILGIPHPPGTPLFMILGRFSILALPFQEVALRMNFISVLSSALTVMVTFLFAEKLIRMVLRDKAGSFGAYVGGLAAAVLLTFSDTFWFNAVEAEVYGLAMLAVMLISWLSLLWLENRHNASGPRYLILIVYLAFLGVGLHLYTVMTLPAVFILMMMADRQPRFNVPMVMVTVGLLAVMADMGRFIAESSHGIINLAWAAGLIGSAIAFFRADETEKKRDWALSAWFFLAALISFTAQPALSEVKLGFYLLILFSAPAILFGLHLWKKEVRPLVPLLITGLGLLAVIHNIGNFHWWALGTLVVAIAGLLFTSDQVWKAKWRISVWMCVAAIVGFSSHAYIPIRSAQDPRIDENDPQTYSAYQAFVERKQYGSESMLRRAFHRRGQLHNQFFTHPHMGYGGYMLAQYLPWKVGETRGEDNQAVVRGEMKFKPQAEWLEDSKFAQFALFALFQLPLLGACWYAYRRNPALGTYVFLLYFLSSFGLIFYMNFADGTQLELRDYQYWLQSGQDPQRMPPPVHLEVRDRDYFYTPAFIFMAVLFGMGVSFLYRWMRDSAPAAGRMAAKPVAGLLVLLLAAIPAFSNYKEHNRSGMYIPYDYAYNLLMSCRPNSILFTNGDNDTFPLWFMQEVEGIRKDVRVVNLSLVNTNWYIKELNRHEPKLKLGFSDAEIDAMQPQVGELKRSIPVPGTPIVADVNTNFLKVQDIMVLHLVMNNYPQRPVHFAVTVSDDNMMGLGPYLEMEGMVYTLTNEKRNKAVNLERTVALVDSVYRYRGLGDGSTFIDGNTAGMLTNYWATNYRLVQTAQERIVELDREIAALKASAGEGAEAVAEKEKARAERVAFAQKYLDMNREMLPESWRAHYHSAQFYEAIGRKDKAEEAWRAGLAVAPDPRMFAVQLGQFYLDDGRNTKAESLFRELNAKSPAEFEFAYGLHEAYMRQDKVKEAKEVLAGWLEGNPGHQYASIVRQQIQGMEARLSKPVAPAPQGPDSAPGGGASAAPVPGLEPAGAVPAIPAAPAVPASAADTPNG